MQNPSGKLLGLVALFAAIGIITATGAFTTVSAERTATIDVAGDSSALLALEPTDGANGDYASLTTTDSGVETLEINFDAVDGAGVNDDATTDIPGVFTITNNGNQDVEVSITDRDLDDDGNEESSPEDDAVTFYSNDDDDVDRSDSDENLEDSSVTLGPGDTVTVSIWIDTTSVTIDENSDKDLVDEITVTAEAAS